MTAPSIMPLGDSLTAPYVPTVAKLLGDAKVPFRLIGTQGTAPLNHEGHGGYRVQMLADGLLAPSTGYLAKVGVPSVAILCAGTNDLYSMPFPDMGKIVEQWTNLVAAFKARGSKVIVCTIPRWTGQPTTGAQTFNAAVRAYVRKNSARTTLVDLERDIALTDLSSDGVHLSAAGAQKMGRLIARALSAKVGSGVAKNPITAAADEVKRRRIVALGLFVAVGAALYFS